MYRQRSLLDVLVILVSLCCLLSFVISGCVETTVPSAPALEETEPLSEESDEETYGEDIRATASAAWTIMVYMAADNNLYGDALLDLNEMVASGIGGKDRVNVVVLLDGGGETLYRVIKDGRWLDCWVQTGNENSGDGKTLANFIRFVRSNYPARRYALILWDHGGGWRDPGRGICVDETAGDIIEIPELAVALQAGGVHFDLIGMDACLMAMVEVAYEIRNRGDILVASQASEPGTGWDYFGIFRRLSKSPTMSPTSLAQEIVKGYSSYYGSADVTLSVIKLSKIKALAQAIDKFAQFYRSEGIAMPLNNRTISADNPYIDPDYGYVDIYNAAQLWLNLCKIYGCSSSLKSALKNVQAKLKNAVLYNRAGGYYRGTKGLSIYLPYYYGQCPIYGETAYYNLAFARDTAWDDFLAWWCSD